MTSGLNGCRKVRPIDPMELLNSEIQDSVRDRGKATPASWKVREWMESTFLAETGAKFREVLWSPNTSIGSYALSLGPVLRDDCQLLQESGLGLEHE
jgi:hypothetical protein